MPLPDDGMNTTNTSTTGGTAERSVGASCAHALGPAPARGERSESPSGPELEALRSGLGARLAEVRTAAGWGTRALAARSGVSRSMIRHLEAGDRRPSAATLRYLAGALAPADPGPLAAQLAELAGASLRADTEIGPRRRERARRRAARAAARTSRRRLSVADPAVYAQLRARELHDRAVTIMSRSDVSLRSLYRAHDLLQQAEHLDAEAGRD